ncbi:MAG: ferrous iron transport protein B [Candidatus Zixiibacteriota bacterium]|jgi:ferrous iron transport protein B
MKETITVGLAGNPNSGKTSIFNNLTGGRQHVGNWPGVTVEKKEGSYEHRGAAFKVVDLPGTYSLGAYSPDEMVARDFVLSEESDVIVNVVDASNLERNLYLTVQLLEMGANVVVALNMYDLARKKYHVDPAEFSKLLGVPVVPTVATSKRGMKELREAIAEAAQRPCTECPVTIRYGAEVEPHLDELTAAVAVLHGWSRALGPRWAALKLLEGDENVGALVRQCSGGSRVVDEAGSVRRHLKRVTGDDAEVSIADHRYGFIRGLVEDAVRLRGPSAGRVTLSDKIDKVVTNRFLGLPLFLAAAYALFELTFKVADPLVGYLEAGLGWLSESVTAWTASSPPLLTSFLVDGVLGGVGNVLVFVPNIFLLFLGIAILEDCGYMARAAFIMDRLMHKLGLHGRSFVPMLIGFGCNVPAIMATRTLESRRDRMITILVNPLMSCSARLPVYVLFVGVFFAAHQGLVIWSLYLLGIFLAIVMAKIFGRFLFRGETAHFVMELPPYRLPTLRGITIHMWERGWLFLKRAGGIIFAIVVLLWGLSNLPPGVEYAGEDSLVGIIGSAVAPLLAPAGFGEWKAAVALIFGFLAKEVVVGTLGILYGTGEEGLAAVLGDSFTPLSAYAFMVMTLIYIPCMATIAVIKRETNSWRWTAFAVGYSLVLGWVAAVIVYQVGRLFGLG